MGATVVDVVGREEELRAAAGALAGAESAIVVFRGEAGAGKTTLWEATTNDAGRCVLGVRPAEAERRLALSAVADLLEPVADRVLPRLPLPQRRAVEAALLITDVDGDAFPARALGAAVVSTLGIVSGERGALLAVDDFQWLDAASRTALEFALRRLSRVRASAVLAFRAGDGDDQLPKFDPSSSVSVIAVGPLSLGAVQRLVADRVGLTLPRPLLRRVYAVSGGNPLYALELAAALRDRGLPIAAGEELPLPPDLDSLLRARICALPPSARQALATAAALAEPRIEIVEGEGDLQPALDAGLVRTERHLVRFRHPLLASAALSLLAPNRRRQLHARLAALVEDVEQRARHLALAQPEPEESVAVVLEEAAARANARGAPAVAAELLQLALERTTDPGRVSARRAAAAWCLFHAGEVAAAVPLAEEALADAAPGPARASVLTLLSLLHRLDLPRAAAFAEQAWSEARGDAAAEALAARQVSFTSMLLGDVTRARDYARHALARADELSDPMLAAVVSIAGFVEAVCTGRVGEELLAIGLAAEERSGGLSEASGARLMLAIQLIHDERLSEARAQLERLLADLEAVGDEYRVPEALYHLVKVELHAGRPRAAAAAAARAAELSSSTNACWTFFDASIAAHLGQVEQAREQAEAARAAAAAANDRAFAAQAAAALGFLELSLGDAAAAAAVLEPVARDIGAAWPALHPALIPVLPNLIDALIALGRFDAADLYLDRLEERGRAVDSCWALSQAARARALVAAADGDLTAALSSFEQALREHERMEGPFERGRTLLAQGTVLRRARQRRAARASLTAALAIFEQVEAPLWAAKARAELSRIGGRSSTPGLTPTEERIARLVADGRSNKEVATELVVTVRTVETHLTKIYAKLGVRSRTALARHLAA